ncbi:unnamed protein product, partial [Ectocarpus sp. 12 AP-2014]
WPRGFRRRPSETCWSTGWRSACGRATGGAGDHGVQWAGSWRARWLPSHKRPASCADTGGRCLYGKGNRSWRGCRRQRRWQATHATR